MTDHSKRDPNWPRASGWLAGETLSEPAGRLAIIGAPLARGSITPGRCDLAPTAIRKALERFSTYDLESARDVRGLRAQFRHTINYIDHEVETGSFV